MIIEYVNMTAEGPKTMYVCTYNNNNPFLPTYGDTIVIHDKKYNVEDRICKLEKNGVDYLVTYELLEIR